MNGALFGLCAGLATQAPLITVMLTIFATKRAGSYQRQADQTPRVYRLPLMLAVGVVTGLIELSVVLIAVQNPDLCLRPSFAGWSAAVPTVFAAVLIALVYVAGIVWMRRTYTLVLAPERKAYRTVDASGVAQWTRTGHWSDISGSVCGPLSAAKGMHPVPILSN
jgi:hypothetical protein